ncbi:rnhA [Symbiodinium natans]|uniref:ribonuclease H n=1 Tax=Symbiodinium natans TaxID=878477 RepID=A0A812U8Y8_9DINO|nr:rnhA [Symbiodinium natans]
MIASCFVARSAYCLELEDVRSLDCLCKALSNPGEATVSADSLRPKLSNKRPLEDEELCFDDAFETLGAQGAKDVGNLLFKLGDMEAAAEFYTRGLKLLESCAGSAQDNVEWVLANRHGSLQPARVVCRGAADRLDLKLCGTGEVIEGIPGSAVLGVRLEQLMLQGSLHLNRSRALTQLGHQAEAAQDLSIVISLWATHSAAGSPRVAKDEECKEQLVKAYYLRAKTRLSRQRIEPARNDLAAAAALRPGEATAALLRQAERELEAVQKEKVRSNKKLAKEIAKFADAAMSGLECLEDALRLLGERPTWKQLPNTQQQHQCTGWRASVSHYATKGTVFVQGADAAVLEAKLKHAIEAASQPGDSRAHAALQAIRHQANTVPQGPRAAALVDPPVLEGESWYLYLDGACPTNQNVHDVAHSAGWGVAVYSSSPGHGKREAARLFGPVEVNRSSPFSLGAEVCSNNTAELTAFGEALLWLRDEAPGPKDRPAVLCYDSQYAKKAMTGENRAHANLDLVASVQGLWQDMSTRRRLQLNWVKGHAGDVGNELADKLANEGATGRVSKDSKRWSQRAAGARPEPEAKRARRMASADVSHALAGGAHMANMRQSARADAQLGGPSLEGPSGVILFGPKKGQSLHHVSCDPPAAAQAIGALQAFLVTAGLWEAFEQSRFNPSAQPDGTAGFQIGRDAMSAGHRDVRR